MRVTVTIPDKLLTALDLYCHEVNKPRSVVISDLVEDQLLKYGLLKEKLKFYERDKRFLNQENTE